MLVGYARVSTTEQSLEVQLDQLAQAGVEKVFSEQRSGKRAANRPELQRALDFCREGDTFVVTFPGSRKGAEETLEALLVTLIHMIEVHRKTRPHKDGYQ